TALNGKVAWQKDLGAFQSEHGYGSSPVLFGSLVIITGDGLKDCFVTALDTRTGKVAWRAPRKPASEHGRYATPALGPLAGQTPLILTGVGEVWAYDPRTGKQL